MSNYYPFLGGDRVKILFFKKNENFLIPKKGSLCGTQKIPLLEFLHKYQEHKIKLRIAIRHILEEKKRKNGGEMCTENHPNQLRTQKEKKSVFLMVPCRVALCCFSKEIFIIHATSDDSNSMLKLYL